MVVFGETSTGAGHDIERATTLVPRMVTEFGMSHGLGPVMSDRNRFGQLANVGLCVTLMIGGSEALDKDLPTAALALSIGDVPSSRRSGSRHSDLLPAVPAPG